MNRWFSFIYICSPILSFGQMQSSTLQTTMLLQANAISNLYEQDVAKASPPPSFPLIDPALDLSSVWFDLNPDHLLYAMREESPLPLTQEPLWKMCQEIGFDGLFIQGVREPGQLSIKPSWTAVWPQIVKQAQMQQITLLGSLIGNATMAGSDFQAAIRNNPEYASLYHTIEIDPSSWKTLPKVPVGNQETNVPWLTLQTLQKQGYVPENFTPYIKESAWNVTDEVIGVDGKSRRWIYLKEGKNNPVLAWLSPSFAAYRLAAGDVLHSFKQLGNQILRLDGNLPKMAQETISLFIRKMGGYSVATTDGTIISMQNASTDLIYDAATRAPLLHALITQNAEALRMIYRLLIDNRIKIKQLVHSLQPFDRYACDWVELATQPKQKFRYFEEQVTGEILKQRLLKEDVLHLGSMDKISPSTWVDLCARALGYKNFEDHKEEISNAHLLLAFTYAMQPGVFSLSSADLLGALPQPQPNLGTEPQNTIQYLYDPLTVQMKNPRSFASKIRAILQARSDANISTADLIAVLPSPNPGTLLLLSRLPTSRMLYLLAVNFGRKKAQESLDQLEISQTCAIDVVSQLAEEKIFSSSQFSFSLPPLSGRAFYFQPKYYD